ncbi:MAG: hypothetical protein D6732_05110 [Methanobacteriota archaeon]|nr:MAG: hypothetical protein D6732_05110 [Euryarchaeota archaeon]
MAEYYKVQEDGTLQPSSDFGQEPDQVYIVIDHDKRNLFLWKGSDAGVRLKFIGSRAMSEKRQDLGFHYQIHVLDQGEETELFLAVLEGKEVPSAVPKRKVYEIEPEAPPNLEELAKQQGISVEEATKEFQETMGEVGDKFGKMGGLTTRPKKTLLTELSSAKSSATAPVPQTQARSSATPPSPTVSTTPRKSQKNLIDEATELLKELGDPKGYTREMVVVGDQVYRVKDQYQLEELDTPLEGIFRVDEFTPRLICESGKVKVIELLKRTGLEEDMDETLTQNLSDLTSMFMIEIE